MIHWLSLARFLFELLLLLLLLRGVRALIGVWPMSPTRRTAIDQAMPVMELVVGVMFSVAAIQRLFSASPHVSEAAVLIVLVTGLWLSRFALTNFASGVLLRAGGAVTLGDRIQLDGVHGRVIQFGYRALTLETAGGDEAVIPYSRLSQQSVVRTPMSEGAFRHTFVVVPPEQLSTGAGARHVTQLAMLCHWSSAAQAPRIEIAPGGELQVTVFALERERGPDVEAFVRKALASGGVA